MEAKCKLVFYSVLKILLTFFKENLKMKTKLTFLTLLILAMMCITARATTYYVATDGNDLDPGTLALPFETIQKACDTVGAGDTIEVRVGTYNESIDIDPTRDPNDSNYITVQPYNSEIYLY